MILLGIDFGDSRTGIARLNTSMPIATPLPTLKSKNINSVAEYVAKTATEEQAELIVLGLPLNMDGSHGPRADKVKLLGSLISEQTDIPIEYSDERLTSSYAHTVMNFTDTRGKKRKDSVDAVAATMILQSYYDKNKLSFE